MPNSNQTISPKAITTLAETKFGGKFNSHSGPRKPFLNYLVDQKVGGTVASVNSALSKIMNGKDVSPKFLARFSAALEILQNKEDVQAPTTATQIEAVETEEEEVVLTDEEILEETRQAFEVTYELIEGVADANIDSVIISGGAGIGKSHSTFEILDNILGDAEYTVVSGKSTLPEIYKILFKAKDGGVVVLDDINVFDDEDTLNIFKIVMETVGRRRVSYLSGGRWMKEFAEEEGVELEELQTFDFQGRLIFLTNRDFTRDIEKGTKISKHLEAVRDRSFYVDLKLHTNRQKFVWVSHILRTSIAQREGVNSEVVEEILAFFSDNMTKLHTINIRSVIKVLKLVRQFQHNWKRIALVTLTNS